MELGKKLRQARLESGLSQRQVCGDTITRNMLSLIENGGATPSLDTLTYLARQLNRPVSYFLDEQTLLTCNRQVMEQARRDFAEGDPAAVLAGLEQYQKPDPVYDMEQALLEALSCITLAEAAISEGKLPFAMRLLDQAELAGKRTPYYTPELQRRRLLVLAQLTPTVLPADDRELLLRAQAALKQGDALRAAQYLDAAEEKETPHWNYLRGMAHRAQRQYPEAAVCLQKAMECDPKACTAALEECYREQGDYKQAYHYACLLREMEK